MSQQRSPARTPNSRAHKQGRPRHPRRALRHAGRGARGACTAPRNIGGMSVLLSAVCRGRQLVASRAPKCITEVGQWQREKRTALLSTHCDQGRRGVHDAQPDRPAPCCGADAQLARRWFCSSSDRPQATVGRAALDSLGMTSGAAVRSRRKHCSMAQRHGQLDAGVDVQWSCGPTMHQQSGMFREVVLEVGTASSPGPWAPNAMPSRPINCPRNQRQVTPKG